MADLAAIARLREKRMIRVVDLTRALAQLSQNDLKILLLTNVLGVPHWQAARLLGMKRRTFERRRRDLLRWCAAWLLWYSL